MITKKENEIRITIPKKFSEKQIGVFMNNYFNEYKRLVHGDIFFFDFTQTEWIANQNLLLLSGLIKYLYHSEIDFKIKLLPDDYRTLNKRKVEQICELWYVWQLSRIFNKTMNDFEKYIDRFSDNTLRNLCKIHGIDFENFTNNHSLGLFDDRYSVIPFVSLNYIADASYDNIIEVQINPVYDLNRIIANELEKKNCQHPFISKTISAIITKELYDNFLDHFQKSIFKSNDDWAFMSISLRGNRENDTQYLFKRNFEEEELEETKTFFFDEETKKYKNENLIQFSFTDFGRGIVDSLKDQYKIEYSVSENDLSTQIDENEVIKYAFKHNSSRNPILDKYEKTVNYIPRGLYDLLVIVKRYKGLLIVRSNYGKILYNFSDTNNSKNPVFFDKEKKEYFPGTYVSIYIPALEGEFDKSVIQPDYDYLPKKNIPTQKRNLNLFSILSELEDINTKDRYKHLIRKLSEELKYDEKNNWLTYISFFNITDKNIIKKILFYLIGSYEINEHNSIIIVYPPSKNIIEEINNEVRALDKEQVIQDYKVHPIPLIDIDIDKNEINLNWIGIFIEEDKKKLNELLFDVHSLILSDLKDGYKAVGNTNSIDKYGNFVSSELTENKLLAHYETTIIEDAIKEFDCIKGGLDDIYLCNGNANYYQESFLQLTDVLNNRRYNDTISSFLLHGIKTHIKSNNPEINDFDNEIVYIAITASSQKLLKALIRQKDDEKKQLIKKENCLFLDSYINFENEIQNKIKEGIKYVLVCDTIATGNLTMRLESMIKEYKGSQLILVAVIVNTLDTDFDGYDSFKKEFIDKERFIYLHQSPIKKFKRKNLSEKQRQKAIRINPYTNCPITLSDEITGKDSILISNEELLECIEDYDIEIGFKLFNKLVHPYFFRTAEILKRENDIIRRGEYNHSIIYKIFKALQRKSSYREANYVFYPKDSDIEQLDIDQLFSKILGLGGVQYFELERYNPGNGWKFPHTTDFLKCEITDKIVLILDDGSCSGDSLYQMINELAYYNPKIINVLSLIGRVEDHKREFFSRIKSIRGINNEIGINVYFGTYWHLPTFYQETNPYSDEIVWLEKICEISNVPEKIRDNALKIKTEIKPEAIKKEDYRFFPKNRITEKIPRKEILTARNEIGKVISYRFYIQSFEWFNKHFSKGLGNKYKDMDDPTKKKLEELVMCFLYEPYLYMELVRVISEIKGLMEDFVENIIFKQSLNIEDLQYKWRKPDIVHLFFIAYQDNNLIAKLDLDRFKQLLVFSEKKINYVLYKLFYYSPLNKKQYKDIFAKIKTEILVAYLSPENLNVEKNVKLFNYFIESLPGEVSFREVLKTVHEEYENILDIGKHKESVSNKIQHSLTCLEALRVNVDNIVAYNKLIILIEQIVTLVNKILSITASKYKPYFSIYLSWFEGDDPYSLRNIQKRFALFLIKSHKEVNIIEINTDIIKLQNKFFNSESIPYKIFSKITIENIKEKILEQKNENTNITFTKQCSSASAYFSEYIFKEIVLKDIFDNFDKYADKNENIIFDIKIKDGRFIEITITNKSNEQDANGGFIGIHQIKQLNECPHELFEYSTQKDSKNNIFKQTIILKKI